MASPKDNEGQENSCVCLVCETALKNGLMVTLYDDHQHEQRSVVEFKIEGDEMTIESKSKGRVMINNSIITVIHTVILMRAVGPEVTMTDAQATATNQNSRQNFPMPPPSKPKKLEIRARARDSQQRKKQRPVTINNDDKGVAITDNSSRQQMTTAATTVFLLLKFLPAVGVGLSTAAAACPPSFTGGVTVTVTWKGGSSPLTAVSQPWASNQDVPRRRRRRANKTTRRQLQLLPTRIIRGRRPPSNRPRSTLNTDTPNTWNHQDDMSPIESPVESPFWSRLLLPVPSFEDHGPR
jgi:hypothetical protein